MTDSTLTSDSWPTAPTAASPPSECLSDDEVLGFAMGRLETNRHHGAELHLDICELCQHLVSEAMHGIGCAPTLPLSESSSAAWNTMFQPGTLAAERYLIRRFIARGGMGEVYEAFDQVLQQVVALKTVTSTASDSSSAVRRLMGEVQLARRVTHANVCRIFDIATHSFEESSARVHFLTMEFVEGRTLGQSLRESGALPLSEAERLARQLLLGLSAAHAAGVMHRDFKSDNVILRTEADGECIPVILDFGLARALDQDGASASNPLVGTLGYIAPEQLLGKPLTKASDVYSFGVVWFEMLTGKGPFAREVAGQRQYPRAPAPSAFNPRVPKALDALVLRCLDASPSTRFQDAGEVLAALNSLQTAARPERRWLLPVALAACVAGVAAFRATPPSPQARGPIIESLRSAIPLRSSKPPSTSTPFTPSAPRVELESSAKETPHTKPSPKRAATPVPLLRSPALATNPPSQTTTAAIGLAPRKLEPTPWPSASESPKKPRWENPFAAPDPAPPKR